MAKVTDVKSAGIESLKLELNTQELQFLIDVMNRIGGDSETTRRSVSQKILHALMAAGVDTYPRFAKDISGHISFAASKEFSEDPYKWPQPDFDEEVPF